MKIFHLPLPHCLSLLCFPGGAAGKNLPAKAGNLRDTGLIPGSGRSPRVGSGNPLWYSCLWKPMDRGVWWATVHEVTKSRTQLNMHPYFLYILFEATFFLLKDVLEQKRKLSLLKLRFYSSVFHRWSGFLIFCYFCISSFLSISYVEMNHKLFSYQLHTHPILCILFLLALMKLSNLWVN